jgi:ParB family chromosome partitioning protein
MLKEQPRRLGRGLAALLGDSVAPVPVTAPGVQTLSVADLEPSPFQPRRGMDEEALTELAASISQRGILQPLLVRPKPGKPGEYQIIAGERRWRAAQKARLHEVPVLVRDLSDTDAMAAGLVENLQREDLNPVEEAEGYQRLITEFRLSHEALGEAIGKSRTHIVNMLRILKLPDAVLHMVKDGSLSAGHARVLVGHSDPLAGAKSVVARGLTVRETEEMVANLGRTFTDKILRKPPRMKDEDIVALTHALGEKLGMKVNVTFNGKSGTLIMRYENLDQLDEILRLLNG